MSSELKNRRHQSSLDETLPFIEISTTAAISDNSSSSSTVSTSIKNSYNESDDLNYLHSPEDLHPRKLPQDHHFRIDSKTRNHHHHHSSSRVYSPLIPPVFREVSSWSSFTIQVMFGFVFLWLIVDWILPRIFQYNTNTNTTSSNGEEDNQTRIFFVNCFEMMIIIHVAIESLASCLIPTLLRFTLAEHTFRNLKNNSVNTNQFLSFQYPRTILKIFIRPFWIFYCCAVITESSSSSGTILLSIGGGAVGTLIRMISFLIASLIGFHDVQYFSKSILYLQYKIDDVSKFIYIDVEYKRSTLSGIRSAISTVALTVLLPTTFLLLSYFQYCSTAETGSSLKTMLVFGASCITFLTTRDKWGIAYWPEALRFNIRFLLDGLSQIGLIWVML